MTSRLSRRQTNAAYDARYSRPPSALPSRGQPPCNQLAALASASPPSSSWRRSRSHRRGLLSPPIVPASSLPAALRGTGAPTTRSGSSSRSRAMLLARTRARSSARPSPSRRSSAGHRRAVYQTTQTALRSEKRRLERDPSVRTVHVSHRIYRALDPEDEQFWNALWGLHNTGQTIQSSSGVANVDVDGRESLGVATGTGVVVAVIDDGVDFSRPDLAGQAWVNPGESGSGKETNNVDDDANGYIDDVNGWDFCHDDKTVHDPDDDFHGTHVSGTIAAKLNGTGIVGVAPNVKLMALKFLGDDQACGWDDQAIAAIDYAKSFGVRISNNSWARPASAPPFGNPADDVPLYEAIEGSGMLFVAAAGNSGQDLDNDSRPSIPASFDLSNILSVAAVDNAGQFASFSNYGETSVDVSAPGVDIAQHDPRLRRQRRGALLPEWHVDGFAPCRRHRSARRVADARLARDADQSKEAHPRHREERGRHGRPDAHRSCSERGRRDRPHRSDGIRAEQLLVRHRQGDRQHDLDSCPLAGGHRRPQRRRLICAAPVGQRRRLDHGHRLDVGPVARPLAQVLDCLPLPGACARSGGQHRRVCRRPAGPPEADPAEWDRGDVQRHVDQPVVLVGVGRQYAIRDESRSVGPVQLHRARRRRGRAERRQPRQLQGLRRRHRTSGR